MSDYSDFIAKVKKLGPRQHKITNSYGVYDAFKFYRKRKPDLKKFVLTESQYFAIIRKMHEKMVQHLLQGNDVKFPGFMGQLEIRKHTIEPRLDKDGKLVYNAPIDWDSTLKLWYEQPEAHKKRIIVRQERRDYYKILYYKRKAKYKNQSYVHFQSSRALRKKVMEAINSGKITGYKQLYRNGS